MKFFTIIFLTVVTIFFSFCKSSNKQFEKLQVQTTEQVDTLGAIIQTIEFKQIATGEDLKIFEDGFIPWISFDSPKKALTKLIDPDKIVLPYLSC